MPVGPGVAYVMLRSAHPQISRPAGGYVLWLEQSNPVSVRGVRFAPKHRRILGQRVRFYRKLAGFSQEKLAEKAELAPSYVSDIERGRENKNAERNPAEGVITHSKLKAPIIGRDVGAER